MSWALTCDGIITLIVGLLAFLGVIYQIRASAKNVQTQIGADLERRREEGRKRMQATARAMLFEVVNFGHYYKKHVLPRLERAVGRFPTISTAGPDSFAAYHANAQSLGDFDGDTVEAVVKFYAAAEWFLSTLKDYRWSLADELRRNPAPPHDAAPMKLLEQLRDLRADVESRLRVATEQLCGVAGIDPEIIKGNNAKETNAQTH